MREALSHRGPDDAGHWVDPASGIALAHRRLSVVDLSAAGHQPMRSPGDRYVIAFNGEIYNHQSIRSRLQVALRPTAWHGHSDTQTLLAAFEQWGIEETLAQCIGMFAIAVWDIREKSLILCRDRMGEKPLYFGWVGSGELRAFAFASEIKALRAYPGFEGRVCRQALAQYLRFCYVPAPRSIYRDIYKLEPGCLLRISGRPPLDAPTVVLRPGDRHGSLEIRRWWSLSRTIESAAGSPFRDERESVSALEESLTEAIKIQAVADVPLGAFLSGGVDSSCIVALLRRQSNRPVKTFTIGFDEAGYDESPFAAAVAKHLETEHHEMRVTARTALEIVPQLPWMYDEPFADSSQVPTHLVCKAAREHVTVALSGDAGDELFGGYNRYFWGDRIWSRLSWIPFPIRRQLGLMLQRTPTTALDILGMPIASLASRGVGAIRIGEKLHKLGARLEHVKTMADLYRSLVSEWDDPASLILNDGSLDVHEPASLIDDPLPTIGVQQSPLPMMYQDAMSYLADDILCKVDRAAMAVGLETRVPFLDHRVIETAWRMPLDVKIRAGVGKWALRQVLYKHVPKELIERPKAGFAMPIGQWLRGPLKPWAEELISSARLSKDGFFRPAPIRKKWAEHISGRADHTPSLWTILMFQAWLESSEHQRT